MPKGQEGGGGEQGAGRGLQGRRADNVGTEHSGHTLQTAKYRMPASGNPGTEPTDVSGTRRQERHRQQLLKYLRINVAHRGQ